MAAASGVLPVPVAPFASASPIAAAAAAAAVGGHALVYPAAATTTNLQAAPVVAPTTAVAAAGGGGGGGGGGGVAVASSAVAPGLGQQLSGMAAGVSPLVTSELLENITLTTFFWVGSGYISF